MKKFLLGIALWLIAFAVPFRYAFLDTGALQHAEGAENIKGLIGFVVGLALLFAGYALVDSGKASAKEEGHGH